MKFKLCCFFFVLAHPYLGHPDEGLRGLEAWRGFDASFYYLSGAGITEALRNPILKEKAIRAENALYKYLSNGHNFFEWNDVIFAEGYLSQLTLDEVVLSSAQNNLKEIDSDDKLGPALDDLYLKANACLNNNGKAIGSVTVTVHTKKSGVEVSNWRVVCMAKILRLYSGYSPTAFPQLSSPTEWKLAPGKYIMWAEDPQTGNKSFEQEIPIDRDQPCDLAVP